MFDLEKYNWIKNSQGLVKANEYRDEENKKLHDKYKREQEAKNGINNEILDKTTIESENIVNLNDLRKDELIEQAKKMNLEFDEKITKKDLIELISNEGQK